MTHETPTAHEQKAVLRRHILQVRQEIKHTLAEVSSQINGRLRHCPEWEKAQIIMAYLAMPTEVSVDGLIAHALQEKKTVCVPVLRSAPGVMESVQLVSLDAVCPRRLGIREPIDTTRIIRPEDIDLVLVPGVSFQANGARIGMGAGYYDRFLVKTNAVTIGICPQACMSIDIPMMPYDHYVDYVVTETTCYVAKRIA